MKIAYFVSNRSIFPGGKNEISASSGVIFDIIKHLSKKHQITLYAAKGTKASGVKVVDLNLKPFQIDSNIENTDWTTKAVIGMKQIYVGELLKNADQYDIIHLNTEPIYLGFPFTELSKTPILFTMHNSYHQNLEKEIFSFYDGKVYLSALSKNQANTLNLKQKVPVIYNGLEISKFPFEKNNEDYFLFMGRLVKDKGIDIFLELSENNKDKSFYIAGKGDPYYEKLIAKKAQENKNIKFFGLLPRDSQEWFNLLSKAKAVIMPIQWEEPFGLVATEAMACGTPVVAFAKGAMPEIIVDGKTGFIVNDSELAGLNSAIKTLSNLSKEEYLGMRNQARKHVEDSFSSEKMAYTYEKLYLEIIENFKKGVRSF